MKVVRESSSAIRHRQSSVRAPPSELLRQSSVIRSPSELLRQSSSVIRAPPSELLRHQSSPPRAPPPLAPLRAPSSAIFAFHLRPNALAATASSRAASILASASRAHVRRGLRLERPLPLGRERERGGLPRQPEPLGVEHPPRVVQHRAVARLGRPQVVAAERQVRRRGGRSECRGPLGSPSRRQSAAKGPPRRAAFAARLIVAESPPPPPPRPHPRGSRDSAPSPSSRAAQRRRGTRSACAFAASWRREDERLARAAQLARASSRALARGPARPESPPGGSRSPTTHPTNPTRPYPGDPPPAPRPARRRTRRASRRWRSPPPPRAPSRAQAETRRRVQYARLARLSFLARRASGRRRPPTRSARRGRAGRRRPRRRRRRASEEVSGRDDAPSSASSDE